MYAAGTWFWVLTIFWCICGIRNSNHSIEQPNVNTEHLKGIDYVETIETKEEEKRGEDVEDSLEYITNLKNDYRHNSAKQSEEINNPRENSSPDKLALFSAVKHPIIRPPKQPQTSKIVNEKDQLSSLRRLSFDSWKNADNYNFEEWDKSGGFCRTKGQYFPKSIYELETCSWCYIYIPSAAFLQKRKFQRQSKFIRLGNWSGNISVLINGTHSVETKEDFHYLFGTFQEDSGRRKWLSCCEKATACCETMLLQPSFGQKEELKPHFCPRTWDGWQCWNDASNGTYSYAPCPSYIYFEGDPPACTNYAMKLCDNNGKWFRKGRGSEWTNYSTCSAVERIQKKSAVHMAAYAISMILLFPALLIFALYKQLRVPRIRLHQQLFASLLAHAMFVTLFKVAVIVPDINSASVTLTILEENGPGCKILLLLTRYFRLTNYAWMFCEGLYLHRLITAAFVENNSLMIYYVLGWGLPLIPVTIYACFRVAFDDVKCWIVPVEHLEWIFYAPALFSLLVNFSFLVNIIRILVRKLRNTQADEPSQYRKAVKATLFLIPLFGTHLFATIYRPTKGSCELVELYSYLNLLLDGLQGSLVSIIFCYSNNEIHNLLRRSYLRFRDHKRMSASTRRQSLLFFARCHSSTNDSENPGQLIRFTFHPQRRAVFLHPAFLTKESTDRNGIIPCTPAHDIEGKIQGVA
ncbi:calcitonin gene-related peptide type 1 receptor-like isoform X2 [Artemia franciscana]|uniref:Calcitonin receptor n=2 Tax=Artemia franciscana TaxID=6661 RepID=A0AA88HG29_ARTSF|nr:hypothetical protein QYM36_016410 [Artemia franciscana]